jgi:ABC-type Fe3+-hydroxamate transport system substrate-binding protein
MEFIDQMNRKVKLEKRPKRIISLVPSQTELLYHLVLDAEVLGITRFCIHPEEWFRTKTRVGGTKRVNFDTIRGLRPDLIIANKEENTRLEIEALQKEYPVWISDIFNLNDALTMIRSLGRICRKSEAAEAIAGTIEEAFGTLQSLRRKPRVLYLIWQEPFMSVNGNTFIHDMLERCGFENVCAKYPGRYPELSQNEIQALHPDCIFLSSEPFPFSDKHIDWFARHFPGTKTMKVNGEFFSWYGSRLMDSAAYFSEIQKEFI